MLDKMTTEKLYDLIKDKVFLADIDTHKEIVPVFCIVKVLSTYYSLHLLYRDSRFFIEVMQLRKNLASIYSSRVMYDLAEVPDKFKPERDMLLDKVHATGLVTLSEYLRTNTK